MGEKRHDAGDGCYASPGGSREEVTINYEAAARNQFEQGLLSTDTETWENVPEWVREEYRRHAKTNVDAALGITPEDTE